MERRQRQQGPEWQLCLVVRCRYAVVTVFNYLKSQQVHSDIGQQDTAAIRGSSSVSRRFPKPHSHKLPFGTSPSRDP